MKTQFLAICILITLSSASFLRVATENKVSEHAERSIAIERRATRHAEGPTVTVVNTTCEEEKCGHVTGYGYTRCVMYNC